MHGLSMCFKIVLIHEITSFCMKTKWFSVVQCFKGDKIIQSIPFVPYFEGQIKKIGEINPYGTCLLLYSYAIAFIKIFELLCRRSEQRKLMCYVRGPIIEWCVFISGIVLKITSFIEHEMHTFRINLAHTTHTIFHNLHYGYSFGVPIPLCRTKWLPDMFGNVHKAKKKTCAKIENIELIPFVNMMEYLGCYLSIF